MQSITMIKERTSLDSNNIVIHHITKKEEESRGGWYRQSLTIDGLLSRPLKRFNKFWYTPKRYKTHDTLVKYSLWTEEDKNMHVHMRKFSTEKYGIEVALQQYPEIKDVYHDSVWDFFDSIGYNYKDKSVKNTDSLIHIKKR